MNRGDASHVPPDMLPADAIIAAMACPACGAQNPPDARFCNQCGARIAPAEESPASPPSGPQTGSPGAPAAPREAPNAWDLASIDARPPSPGWEAAATPPPSSLGADAPGLTQEALARAGLGRRRSTWPWLVLGAVALFALGATATWWFVHGDAMAPEASPPLRLDDIDVMQLPEGHPPPDGDVDLVTGAPPAPEASASPDAPRPSAHRPRVRSGEEASVTTADFRTAPPTSPSPSSSRRSTPSTTGTATKPSKRPARTGPSHAPTRRHAGNDQTTSGAPSSPASPAPEATGGGANTSSTDSAHHDAERDRRRLERAAGGPSETPADRAYAQQVLFAFKRYWAARARACFSQATRNQDGLSGRVVLRLTIAADGAVARAEPVSNTTGDEGLGRCLAHRARRWRFPPPPGRRPSRVDLPLKAH